MVDEMGIEAGIKKEKQNKNKNASTKPKRSVVRKTPVPLREIMKANDLIKSGIGTNAELLNAGIDAANIKRIVNTLKKQGLIKVEVKYVPTDVAAATSV